MRQKGVLNVVNHRFTVLENDGNNVETSFHIQLVSGYIGIGRGYQHPLFSFRHGQIGLTVFAAPARLYLYKDQKLAVLGNNVDFLMDIVPIALQNLVAFPYQVVDREFLTKFPKIVVLCHSYSSTITP